LDSNRAIAIILAREESPLTLRRFACAFLFVAFVAVTASAQVRANLHGRVLDPSGAAIPNAQVSLIEVATNISRRTISSRSGDYAFTELNPGAYRLEVAANGFQRLKLIAQSIAVGQTANVDLVMTVGSDQRAVTVDATAPLFQSRTSNIQTNIPEKAVVAIPLNSRNFVQLTTLAPGVELPPGTLLPRINGGRPRTNEYLYDGISALQPEPGQVVFFPIIDDIQEFTVEANNVAAEFGRFNGGVVNVATRSGSNDLHGSLYEFFRNEALNARNYFSNTPRKPEYRRNLYGASLGAPIVRDRLFVFAGYQGIKQSIGVTRTSTVPTLAERQGNFAGIAHIYDPASTSIVGGKIVRQEFPNDTINVPLDPAATALLSRIPLPTRAGIANNYTRTANDDDHQNQFDIRVDGLLTQRDRAFGRYSYFGDVEQPVTPFPDGSGAITGSVIGTGGVAGLSNILGQQALFSETHTFTERLLNDLRLGYTRRGNSIAGTTLAGTASGVLGIPGIPTNAAFNNVLPLFTFTGFQQLGASPSTSSQFQTSVWQLTDGVSYSRGRHTMKAGIDFRWYQLNAVAPPNPTGAFAFTVTGTNQQGVTGSGNSFASFLLGQVDNFQIDLQQDTIRPRDHIEEFFLQDDWHATDRLTLNLGARWTLHFPSTEKSDQGAVFNLQTQQLDYLGKNGFPSSARELHYANLAPRIGLAYLVTPKTVVRSGYGIVFIDQSGITTPFTTPQFPFIQNVQQRTQDNLNAAFRLSNGPNVAPIPLTADAGLGQSVYTANRTAGSGYVQQWNLAVQRQLTNGLSLEIAYVGSHIVHVGIPDSNLNQLTAEQLAQGASLLTPVANPYFGQLPVSSSIGGPTVSAAQLLKPFPRFLNVATYRNNTGSTTYNAIEAKIEQRFSHGLYLLFAYTHSKLIDSASAVFSTTVLSSPNSNSLVAADTFRPSLERDSSNGDMPNVTSVSAIYELPAGRGHRLASSGVMESVLGGWSLNAIASLQSGMPVTITQATNFNSFAGYSLQRPTITGDPKLPSDQRTTSRFFNTAVFTTTPQFAIGNASRNPVRGPAYRNLDLALVKKTKLSERTNLEFRAEVFDLTNTPAFAQPNGSFGSPAFGTITSTTTDPRVIQFALRLSR
jgi:Carboxypeptidase regulatory-like domain/TonB dependent receptor